MRHAQVWELQALLKARPILSYGIMELWSDGVKATNLFMDMRKEVLMKRGQEITIDDVRKMLERIQKELSKEISGTYDIKLGGGGLEELEFTIQYLQLKNCKDNPKLLVQGTVDAIKRLNRCDIIKNEDAIVMNEVYLFYRIIETILRARNESILKEGSSTVQSAANFMDMDEDKFLISLNKKREWVRNFWDVLG
jgi:glutamate-ammonia-ligase adenylyltransferase